MKPYYGSIAVEQRKLTEAYIGSDHSKKFYFPHKLFSGLFKLFQRCASRLKVSDNPDRIVVQLLKLIQIKLIVDNSDGIVGNLKGLISLFI